MTFTDPPRSRTTPAPGLHPTPYPLRARREPRRDDPLFVVGLVGRAGSGKSTVAAALERAGAVVIPADQIGHDVTDHDPEVRAALAAEFGRDVYLADGRLDRARVAARVFADADALAWLNRLVHPRILEGILAALGELDERGEPVTVVVDAALMLDWGFQRDCDALLAVVAPEAALVDRLVRARGWTPEHARARLSAQRSQDEFAAAADEVLVNDGTPAELEAAAVSALGRLRARPAGNRA